jgi:hypothetical protein
MSTLNPNAFRLAELAIWQILTVSLADFGQGFVGAPRVIKGALNGVDQWWFAIGGESQGNQLNTTKQKAYDGGATIEAVFTDRARGWQFVVAVMEALPLTNTDPVRSLHKGTGNPSNVYEYFKIHNRPGEHGLWRVTIPLHLVFDLTYFPEE